MTLVAGVFERRLTFEEAIKQPGTDVKPPPRPWTRLRNDPRLEAFIGASLEELHERNTKAGEATQIDAEIRKTAAAQGIPVGEARMGRVDPKAEEFKESVRYVTDPNHGARLALEDRST